MTSITESNGVPPMKTQEEELNNRLIDAITLDKDGNPKFYWHQDQLANLRALIQSELARQEAKHKEELAKAVRSAKIEGAVDSQCWILGGKITNACDRTKDHLGLHSWEAVELEDELAKLTKSNKGEDSD